MEFSVKPQVFHQFFVSPGRAVQRRLWRRGHRDEAGGGLGVWLGRVKQCHKPRIWEWFMYTTLYHIYLW